MKKIFIFILYIFSILNSCQILAQQTCSLELADWSVLENNKVVEQSDKENIKLALTEFIGLYNKFADLYDEENNYYTEQDFLDLLEFNDAGTIYLNDIKSPVGLPEPANHYLELVGTHYEHGFNFCLYSLKIKSIKILEKNLYAVDFEGKKRISVAIENDKPLEKERELSILYRMIIPKDPATQTMSAKISELVLVTESSSGDILNNENKPIRTINSVKDSDEEEAFKRSSTVSSADRSDLRTYKNLYVEAGSGFSPDKKADLSGGQEIKTGNLHAGLGFDFWKSFNGKKKLYWSAGFLLKYHMINNTVGDGTINLGTDYVAPDRAPRSSELKLENFSLKHNIISAYVPIGIMYKLGNDIQNEFLLQATMMPGFSYINRNYEQGTINYNCFYGDDAGSGIKNMEIGNGKKFDSQTNFTFAFRLSPMYSRQIRIVDKNTDRHLGFNIGLDLTYGITPLLKTEDLFNESSEQDPKLNSRASILHNAVTYHSVGLRAGIIYVFK